MGWRGILIVALLLAAGAVDKAAAQSAASGSASQGKILFEQKCTVCHTIGGGKRIGPDLQGITGQRSRDWLTEFISNPHRMIASGDPTATQLKNQFGMEMPDLQLSGGEVSSLIDYLASAGAAGPSPQPEKTAAAPGQAAPAPAAPATQPPSRPASPQEGEKLFTGVVPLQNGGAPCISCHNIAGTPFPGGGSLGPDLTGAYQKFGSAGLASALASLPFPTMAPVFKNHALSATEQQDLEAFFAQAPGRPIWVGPWNTLLGGIILMVLVLIFFQVLWRKRLRKVRGPLAEKG